MTLLHNWSILEDNTKKKKKNRNEIQISWLYYFVSKEWEKSVVLKGRKERAALEALRCLLPRRWLAGLLPPFSSQPAGWVRDQRLGFRKWMKPLISLSFALKRQLPQGAHPFWWYKKTEEWPITKPVVTVFRLPDSPGSRAAYKGHSGSTASYINKLHKWERTGYVNV